LSESRKLCGPGTTERISSLLAQFGLPVSIPAQIPVEGLQNALNLDKKAVATGLRLILLKAIGEAIIDSDSHSNDIIEAIKQSLDLKKAVSTE